MQYEIERRRRDTGCKGGKAGLAGKTMWSQGEEKKSVRGGKFGRDCANT